MWAMWYMGYGGGGGGGGNGYSEQPHKHDGSLSAAKSSTRVRTVSHETEHELNLSSMISNEGNLDSHVRARRDDWS